ncbi:hypothetical protein [Marinitoga sp. 38H-ov]|nr:hypothetical protein [Marinitoga sp. 38H-ov]
MIIIPYLNFKGNCEEAMNFYAKVFGGEITYLMRFKDGSDEFKKICLKRN